MALPAILGAVGIPALARIIGAVLGEVDHPVMQGAAKALNELDQAIAQGQITNDQVAEANRHTEAMIRLEVEQASAHLTQVNQSLRAEIVSQDVYVRRMRPTFGYLMALTWAAQMFAVAYVIVFDPARSGEVMSAMASLTAIWSVGLSVLGIYVYKRSEEKRRS